MRIEIRCVCYLVSPPWGTMYDAERCDARVAEATGEGWHV